MFGYITTMSGSGPDKTSHQNVHPKKEDHNKHNSLTCKICNIMNYKSTLMIENKNIFHYTKGFVPVSGHTIKHPQ